MPKFQRVIAFVVASPVNLLNLTGFTSVFLLARMGGHPAYCTTILSAGDEREVCGTDGFSMISCVPFSEYNGPIDTLVVIGAEGLCLNPDPKLVDWLGRRAAGARRIACVGAGTFLLASAGVLLGKRVTTHWHHVEELARRHPELILEKDTIFVRDGNIISTAGVTAGIDMTLSLVEEDLGHGEAISIARQLVMYMRRPGNEPQLSSLLAQQAKFSGTAMRDLPAWARTRITQRLDVNTLARVVGMSPRTLARQFESHFETTPARWIRTLRLEMACEHLAADALPTKAIARLTGFRDVQSLRRAFLKRFSMSPQQYKSRQQEAV